MIKCAICEFSNEDGALFCEQCKSDLSAPEPVAVQPEPAAAWVAAPVHEESPAAAVLEASAPVACVAVEAAMPADTATLAGIAVAETIAVPDSIPVASVVEVPPPAVVVEAHPLESQAPGNPPASPNLAATAAVEAAVPLAEGIKPKLIVTRGQRVNVEYPIYEGENYIGRADDKSVDIDVEDQEASDRVWSSRQHALILFQEGQLSIEDLNSTNGTFVNRLRVHPGQKRPLQINDVIQIGTVQMKVTV
jgi:hypothetical protein